MLVCLISGYPNCEGYISYVGDGFCDNDLNIEASGLLLQDVGIKATVDVRLIFKKYFYRNIDDQRRTQTISLMFEYPPGMRMGRGRLLRVHLH